MSLRRIHLFGQFTLESDERVLHALDPHRAEELLCYLLLNRARQHHRESLAELLCNECETMQAKKRLRQILWRLQSLLADVSEPGGEPLLLAQRDWIQLNPNCWVWSDVQLFEHASVLVEDLPGEGLTSEQAEVLRRAVGLYRGDLLVGWYEDWCVWERERLQNIYLELLDKLMGYCEVHDQYDSGLAYGEMVLRYDRASERTYQRLMRLHARAHARGLAVRQYERCLGALDQELGVKPSPRTVEIYEQILRGDIARPAPPELRPRLLDHSLRRLLDHLIMFERTLGEFRANVAADVNSIHGTVSV